MSPPMLWAVTESPSRKLVRHLDNNYVEISFRNDFKRYMEQIGFRRDNRNWNDSVNSWYQTLWSQYHSTSVFTRPLSWRMQLKLPGDDLTISISERGALLLNAVNGLN